MIQFYTHLFKDLKDLSPTLPTFEAKTEKDGLQMAYMLKDFGSDFQNER